MIRNIVNFFNTNLGTATIGFIGVIAGCIITYIFNKTYNKTMLKSDIKKKTLDDLQIHIIDSIKESAYLNSLYNITSKEAATLKSKNSPTVGDKNELDLAFENFCLKCGSFEETFSNILIYLDTHQIILNEFINYHQKLSVLLVKSINIKQEIKSLYANKIYISLHKIDLSEKNISKLKELESNYLKVIKEIQFHLDNLSRELQNKNYSKLFNKQIEICNDKEFLTIKLNKNKNKKIDFSSFEDLELKERE